LAKPYQRMRGLLLREWNGGRDMGAVKAKYEAPKQNSLEWLRE